MTELKSKNKLDRKLEKQENSQYAILEFINNVKHNQIDKISEKIVRTLLSFVRTTL